MFRRGCVKLTQVVIVSGPESRTTLDRVTTQTSRTDWLETVRRALQYGWRGTNVSARLESSTVALPWLIRLRWHAVVGECVTIAAATAGFGIELPLRLLFASVALLALTNVALSVRVRRAPPLAAGWLGATLLFDSTLLFFQLRITAGLSNPFSVMLLVEVLLAVLALSGRWVAAVVAWSVLGCTLIQAFPRPLLGVSHAAAAWSAWLANSVAIIAAGSVGAQIAAAVREQTSSLARARERSARSERLASLTTLAAGAAHEFGTPLGTIAIASSELAELIDSAPAEAVEEARIIREEVERCRAILQRMAGNAGTNLGELSERVASGTLLTMLNDQLGPRERERLVITGDLAAHVYCTPRACVQVLTSLVTNALQASREGQAVQLEIDGDKASVSFVVSDRGTGIPAASMPRLGEPFFTTKPPGEGMGLGLFLALSFAELCGGELEIESVEHQGTRVCLRVPRSGATRDA